GYLVAGMKIAAPLALIGAVVGEFVGANRGIGFVILDASAHLATVEMLAGIVCVGLTGTALFLAGAALGGRPGPWLARRDEGEPRGVGDRGVGGRGPPARGPGLPAPATERRRRRAGRAVRAGGATQRCDARRGRRGPRGRGGGRRGPGGGDGVDAVPPPGPLPAPRIPAGGPQGDGGAALRHLAGLWSRLEGAHGVPHRLLPDRREPDDRAAARGRRPPAAHAVLPGHGLADLPHRARAERGPGLPGGAAGPRRAGGGAPRGRAGAP